MSQTASDSKLPDLAPKHAIKKIVVDMLHLLYKGNNDVAWRKKVDAALRAETGVGYIDYDRMPPIALFGPPGQGKTTVFKEAGKIVAKHMGLNPVFNPGNEYDAKDADLVFVSQEMSGVVSNVDFGGIPSKKVPENGEAYMEKLLEKRLTQLSKAGAAIILFDDFSNAAPFIQNNLLSLAEEKRYQNLNLGDRTYVGLTANEGSKDGTNTGRVSSALYGRVKGFYFTEPVQDFMDRVSTQTEAHEFGDGGLCGFLKFHPDMLKTQITPGSPGPYSSPRTMSSAMEVLRRARAYFSVDAASGTGMHNEKLGADLLGWVEQECAAVVGKEAGSALGSYVYTLVTQAEPLAEIAISEKGWDKKVLKELQGRVGNQTKPEEQTFVYQFATACAEKVCTYYLEAKGDEAKQSEVIKRFGRAVFSDELPLNPAAMSFALHHFTRRLVSRDPASRNAKDIAVVDTELAKRLGADLSAGAGGIDEDWKEDMAQILTGASMGNMSMNDGVAKKRTPKKKPA